MTSRVTRKRGSWGQCCVWYHFDVIYTQNTVIKQVWEEKDYKMS